MLFKCLFRVNDEVKEINFFEMLVFVLKWVNDIFIILVIFGFNGLIIGIGNIIGLFEWKSYKKCKWCVEKLF